MPEHEAIEEASEDSAPRPFWSGLLSFGLVSIPVDLYAASRKVNASLRMLDEEGAPLARRYYCPEDDEEVPAEHLVRGYETEDGSYLVVTDEELDALDPKRSREIDLRLFVDRGSLEPIYFERCYFLAPAPESGKAYRLLTSVMEKKRRAGVATFVMRDKQYLVAIFAQGGLLRAETLRFHGQVRSIAQVGLPKRVKPATSLLKQVTRAVAALEADRLPTAELNDEHSEAIHHLAMEKYRRGQDVVSVEEAAPARGAEIIDLMEMLRQSLGASGLTRDEAVPRRKPAPGTAPKTRSRPAREAAPPAEKRAAPAKRAVKGTRATSGAAKKKPSAKAARRSTKDKASRSRTRSRRAAG